VIRQAKLLVSELANQQQAPRIHILHEGDIVPDAKGLGIIFSELQTKKMADHASDQPSTHTPQH